ncbi:UrcA family protein [Aurantiacibacter odishensis]|uniref:UrcA family protein n=1 Tax=Aurantiacibacter odishensis TaxID=1155476 RepID=UPI000E7264E8|nr:UrcA family protein [Aurantiacibacter odishensis]
MKTPKITFALALAAAGMAAAPTMASAEDTQSVRVTYDDLDLSTQNGIEELERRIDRAARQICGNAERTGTHLRNREARACVAETKERINEQFAQVVDSAQRGG